MGKILLLKIKESSISLLPIILIVLIISFTSLVTLTSAEYIALAVSSVFLIIGMSLFNLGADIAMQPMGEYVGSGLTKTKKLGILLISCFVMGLLITIAEPDLSVLANQVSTVINSTLLIVTVGIGVGLFLLIAILKIVFKKNLSSLLMFFYMLAFAFCALLINSGKTNFISMSFDSGGVTTGPITVPFIMALGLGIASTIGGNDSNENSFGLVALCSIGPILAVMLLSLFSNGTLSYTLDVNEYTLKNSVSGILSLLLTKAIDVIKALGLIIIFFFALNFMILKLPKKKLKSIAIGILFAYVGLVIFLTCVEVSFMPIGYKFGFSIANSNKFILVAFAFLLGMVTVIAEPAVYVLNKQVEEVTGGTVSKKSMMIALSIGVGLSICLSVIRIIFNFSILYYLIPGYFISLGLAFFVPKIYTAIAFDSGGVASGPMTSSFILPFAIGACFALQGESEILNLGFGIVAMVAMTPLIAIQVLGFRAIAARNLREKITMKRILDKDDEQIIYFE